VPGKKDLEVFFAAAPIVLGSQFPNKPGIFLLGPATVESFPSVGSSIGIPRVAFDLAMSCRTGKQDALAAV